MVADRFFGLPVFIFILCGYISAQFVLRINENLEPFAEDAINGATRDLKEIMSRGRQSKIHLSDLLTKEVEKETRSRLRNFSHAVQEYDIQTHDVTDVFQKYVDRLHITPSDQLDYAARTMEDLVIAWPAITELVNVTRTLLEKMIVMTNDLSWNSITAAVKTTIMSSKNRQHNDISLTSSSTSIPEEIDSVFSQIRPSTAVGFTIVQHVATAVANNLGKMADLSTEAVVTELLFVLGLSKETLSHLYNHVLSLIQELFPRVRGL